MTTTVTTTTTPTAEISFEEFVTLVLNKFPDKEWTLGIIGSSHGDRFCATYENKEISYGQRPWGLTWEIFFYNTGGKLYSAPSLDEVQEQVW